jgi:oligopeptide/dipeptide ABC transporter ATP-binding protein
VSKKTCSQKLEDPQEPGQVEFRVPRPANRVYDGGMALLEVNGLTVELPTATGTIRPVNDVSLRVEPGEALGLVGESGSGKTLLALALMGLLPEGAHARGEVLLTPQNGMGRSVARNLLSLHEREWRGLRGRDIAMVFQEPMTSLNPVMRVGVQIEEAARAHAAGLRRGESRRRAITALERAAVPEPQMRARQYPHELSGGLRQRAMIAMALAGGLDEPHRESSIGPRLLIADEPTTALDATVQKQILELLGRLRRELGLALIFITHDLGVVAQVTDRLAVMYAGRIVEEGPTGEVLTHPRHPYTAGLLAASPRLQRGALQPIPGSVPRLAALPPGCAFEPRCSLRRPECSEHVPEMRTAGQKHRARCVLV